MISSDLFEWNNEKAVNNVKKHGVTFEEAQTVFDDVLAFIFNDEWHSDEENREVIIGYSAANRLLLAIFTERMDKIRLISAREVTNVERQDYEENRYG